MPVKFCKNCSNLLYPKAPRGYDKLYYACRNCDYEKEAQQNESLVYRNELMAVVTEKAGITEDLEMDPTLPRSNMECPNCHARSCVYFQDQSKRHITNMRLFYKCIACHTVFQDPKAEESEAKNAERARRAERIREKVASDKKGKGGGGGGGGGPEPDKKPAVQVAADDSDSDY